MQYGNVKLLETARVIKNTRTENEQTVKACERKGLGGSWSLDE
jgi:hypothetical protein